MKNDYKQNLNLIQSLDPRIKILVAFIFSVTTSVLSDKNAVIVSLMFPVFLFFLQRVERFYILKRLLLANFFILFIWIFLPFSFPGHNFFKLGNLQYSKEGMSYAYLITLKSNSIILLCIMLLSSTDVLQLIHALRHLFIPDKIVDLFYFFFRYIFEIQREYIKLRNSLRIRGFNPKTNIHTYRTYAYMLGILLVRAYERSEKIYNAMICRGFKGKFWLWHHFVISYRDIVFLFISLIWISITGLIQWKQIIF